MHGEVTSNYNAERAKLKAKTMMVEGLPQSPRTPTDVAHRVCLIEAYGMHLILARHGHVHRYSSTAAVFLRRISVLVKVPKQAIF